MASTDNRRTVDADDIKDGTITPTEFDTVNTPKNRQNLQFDSNSGKMKWRWSIFGRFFR